MVRSSASSTGLAHCATEVERCARTMASNKKENPYLSIVRVSRNDNHGGNMLRRMQVSLNSLLEQLEKYHIESELILVDWNPPTRKPLLKDVIKWPLELKYCTIRIIVAPSSIHQRYKYHDKIPMNIAVADNCGIRRARGRFILPGAMDLLYSDELMSFIASKSLKEDERYRVDRYDVDRKAVQYNTLKERFNFCKKNIIKIRSHAYQDRQTFFPKLHELACGDFQLMSRHYWHLLRGYRETYIVAHHVDGLLSYASYAAGVKEVVLKDPMRIYHIDHDNDINDRLTIREKSRFEDLLALPFIPWRISNKIALLCQRLKGKAKEEIRAIPFLSLPEYHSLAKDIIAGKHPYILNDDTWGLGQETLEEFIIRTADWDRGG